MLKNIFRHLNTVTRHRNAVMKNCFRAGIPMRGLLHDLSKFSREEFFESARHYQGTRSPTEHERETNGFSVVWMHHKGRNKHHFEYWVDIDPQTKKYGPVKMPTKYLIEMFCDRIAASKIYKGKAYTDSSAYDYFMGGRARKIMHPETAKELEFLLVTLKDHGEKAGFEAARKMLKESKNQNKKSK
ncbi:MAG: catalase [Clostridia bacterium]|nr:catalase [Clostridia bacterium]